MNDRNEVTGRNAPMQRPVVPRVSDFLASWSAFSGEIGHSLRLLGSSRLQVSLFAVRLRGGTDAAMAQIAATAAAEALLRLGAVGRLADDGVGLLYLGPRAAGRMGDHALMRHVRELVEERLTARGLGRFAERLEIAASHAWTDELGGVEELAQPLVERAPARAAAAPAFLPAFAQLAR